MNAADDPCRSFDAVREHLLLRDAARLARQLAGGRADPVRFARALAEAEERARQRAARAPTALHYPPELPVVQQREALLEAIRAHPVVVVCGETGSGKTTQLPKLCLELGRGLRGLIGHTQPRRLAARSVARRIAQELDGRVGDLVGFETRFDRQVAPHSLIKLMTDGILLAELQRDRDLLAYDTLIIDEAHERSLNIDFLLGWLKPLCARRPDLKVLITSATLDPERLSRHFGGCPVVQVQGRSHPVEIRYRPADPEAGLEDAVGAAIGELWHPQPRGDVLVFLPGEREIHELSRHLSGRFPRAEVLPLYSRLPAAQQDRVFSPGGAPRIVLSTNVAETSVTVPGIRYVVDTGSARINRFSPRLGVQQLHVEPVSQAAAQQRAGRCGRIGPGICIRLYEEAELLARPAFTDPEILRSHLAGVILQMTALGLGDVEGFDWVDAPESRYVNDGYRLLQTLGALDEQRRLTRLGREIARLPLDPRIARIALAGQRGPLPHAVWALAAALSVQDPHEVPPDAQTQARQKHAAWRHPRSDFLTLLQLWAQWQAWSAQHRQRALRKLAREHYLSYARMNEWEQVYQQICQLLGKDTEPAATLTPELLERHHAALHRALLAGLIDHIAHKRPGETEYQGPRGRRLRIFPGSVLARKSPPWIMSAQLAHTSQLFARVNAAVEVDWLVEAGAHLVKRSLQHPAWNAERGEVSAVEHLSLFGLPLLKRARHYGSEEPREARALFIQHALVGGEWPNKPAFLRHNLAQAEALREKEARLRRPDLLADEAQLFRFYDQRIPAEVCTCAGLRQWLATLPGAPGAVLQMQDSDLLRPGADANVEHRFPDHLQAGALRLKLSYTHDPGTDADGLSVHIPLTQLFDVPDGVVEWLVPGLRTALLEGLIRSLPQKLRRYCTPAAEYASALAASLDPAQGALLPALCTRFQAMTGVRLQPQDFAPDKLAPHLRPRLLLEDAEGRMIAEDDDLPRLRQRMGGATRSALVQTAGQHEDTACWVRDGLSDWDFGALPESVVLPGGARSYPALAALPEGVGLRLFESAAAAEAAHRAGSAALLLQRLDDRVRELRKAVASRAGTALVGTPHRAETLAQALASRAAQDVLLVQPLRTRADWQRAFEARGEFSRYALDLLDDLVRWLQQAAALRRQLRELSGRWPEATADAQAQLESLLAPGCVEAIPDEVWPRIALYLKALGVRLQRLPHKPQRDAELCALLQPHLARLPGPFHPARWVMEEWRIALFAQELRAVGSPGAGRVEALLAG
ncbi:MAG: ATP-dependent RNA helicase HrpA [Gammaproteobacteria bacterium]